MKVASIIFKERQFNLFQDRQYFKTRIKEWLDCCIEGGTNIVVFPGLIGYIYGNYERYLEHVLDISLQYKDLYICTGSYFETDKDETYHSSSIITNGRICLSQRQLYLAKWEKKLGLSRGYEIQFTEINGLKTAILLTADMFYPQVSRYLAMSKVDLVLAPSAIKDGRNMALQISGLWQNVQQNLFFAVESGFKGELFDCKFFSRSAIYGPLEMTDKDNGFIRLEKNDNEVEILTAQLDNEKRMAAIKKFDTLKQLNIDLYKDLFR